MAFPPTVPTPIGAHSPSGVFTRTEDPAKYVVGRARFERPSLFVPPKGPVFEFPVGAEGVRVSGSPGLAEHRYLGDNAPVVQITHRDARRIELRGMLPGLTGATNMQNLIDVITAIPTTGYWILTLPPGIFPRQQFVVVENYEFDHPEDEATDSWAYAISFIRTGVGKKIHKGKKTKTPVNPVGTVSKPPRGVPTRTFTTKSGANTLRAVAKIVYGNPGRWQEIYNKNKNALARFNKPLLELQYFHLPYGIKLHY